MNDEISEINQYIDDWIKDIKNDNMSVYICGKESWINFLETSYKDIHLKNEVKVVASVWNTPIEKYFINHKDEYYIKEQNLPNYARTGSSTIYVKKYEI